MEAVKRRKAVKISYRDRIQQRVNKIREDGRMVYYDRCGKRIDDDNFEAVQTRLGNELIFHRKCI